MMMRKKQERTMYYRLEDDGSEKIATCKINEDEDEKKCMFFCLLQTS